MSTHEQEILLEKLEAEWVGGGAATPLVAELIRLKRLNRAGALARLALAAEVCQDREALEQLLQRTGSPPHGWENAVAAFHRNPTIEKFGWGDAHSNIHRLGGRPFSAVGWGDAHSNIHNLRKELKLLGWGDAHSNIHNRLGGRPFQHS